MIVPNHFCGIKSQCHKKTENDLRERRIHSPSFCGKRSRSTSHAGNNRGIDGQAYCIDRTGKLTNDHLVEILRKGAQSYSSIASERLLAYSQYNQGIKIQFFCRIDNRPDTMAFQTHRFKHLVI